MSDSWPPSEADIAKAMRHFHELDAAPQHLMPSALGFYRKNVQHLPRPTTTQIDNFVQFVCRAHSWYKHLPLLPPGAPFVFCLDPMAGYDRSLQKGGRVINRERTETAMIADRRWPTTEQYRARYGYLAYGRRHGTSVSGLDGENVFIVEIPLGFTTNDGAYQLPREVKLAGCVLLTAAIHPTTAKDWYLGWRLRNQGIDGADGQPSRWPEETGGNETIRKIIEVCDQMHTALDARTTSHGTKQSAEEFERITREAQNKLETLFLPERQRLQRNMAEAINRMLDLVFE